MSLPCRTGLEEVGRAAPVRAGHHAQAARLGSQAFRVERYLDRLDRFVPEARPVPEGVAGVQVALRADQEEVGPQQVFADAVDAVVRGKPGHERPPLEERLQGRPPGWQLDSQSFTKNLVRLALDRGDLLRREDAPQHEISERIEELLLVLAQHVQLPFKRWAAPTGLSCASHCISPVHASCCGASVIESRPA